MKKSLTTIAVIVGVLAFATPALAHTPNVSPSCSGLAVSLASYEGTSTNNRVTITIDNVATVVNFGGSYSHTFTWSQTAAHTWSVVIDANRSTGDPTAYDRSFSGTWQACQVAPTTTTTTTTVAPTTTTTVEPTTTTVEATTTTVEEATTTTTLLASEAPALVATTTTTTTALLGSSGANQSAAAVQLPATGSESGRIAIVGLAIFGLGLTLMAVRRRSRPVGG